MQLAALVPVALAQAELAAPGLLVVLAQAVKALAALVALAQVGLAALELVAVVPKLWQLFGLAPCLPWLRSLQLTCNLFCFGSVGWSDRLADLTYPKLCHPKLPTKDGSRR